MTKYVILICCLMTVLNTYAQDSLTNSQKDLLYILQHYRKLDFVLDSIEKAHYKKYNRSIYGNELARKYHKDLTSNFIIKDYDNPIIKKEFLSILSPEYTDEELKALQKIYVKSNYYVRGHKDCVKPKIDVYSIRMAGSIYFKEAIPILVGGLKYPYQYDIGVTELALARMQVEPYYSEAINNCIKKIKVGEISGISDIFYIGTQEAIQRLEGLLYITNKVKYILTYDYPTIPMPLNQLIYANIAFSLKEDEYIRKNGERIALSTEIFYQEDLKYIQQYFKKNKGKIQFQKYWYKEK